MSKKSLQVQTVIGDYVKQRGTLVLMEEIHRQFTGMNESFSRWENVQKQYGQMDWDAESFTDFLTIVRDEVEGDVSMISESYFDIVEPETPTVENIKEKLSTQKVENEDDMRKREGFTYRVRDDGVIVGTYHYAKIDVEITAEPQLEEIPTPKNIKFEVRPEEKLLISKTTSPAQVRKLGAIFNNKTEIEVRVSGDQTVFPDSADENVVGFINEFRPPEGKVEYE